MRRPAGRALAQGAEGAQAPGQELGGQKFSWGIWTLSMAECARQLGVTTSAIALILKRDKYSLQRTPTPHSFPNFFLSEP